MRDLYTRLLNTTSDSVTRMQVAGVNESEIFVVYYMFKGLTLSYTINI